MTEPGVLINIDNRPALQFVRTYHQPIERVWQCVTDPDLMARWFPSQVIGDRKVGSPLHFDDADQRSEAIEAGEPTRAEGPQFTGKVLAYDPPNLFSFTWGSESIEIVLNQGGDRTVMTFTQFLSHPSIAARNGSGWHACLHNLDTMLEAEESPIEFDTLYADYLARMGPSLGVPSTDGSMTWERGTHVDRAKIEQATATADGMQGWGAADHAGEPIRWTIEPHENWTLFRLRHSGIGNNAQLASTWHALLLQLDMYLAADFLMPADPGVWFDRYRELLSSQA